MSNLPPVPNDPGTNIIDPNALDRLLVARGQAMLEAIAAQPALDPFADPINLLALQLLGLIVARVVGEPHLARNHAQLVQLAQTMNLDAFQQIVLETFSRKTE